MSVEFDPETFREQGFAVVAGVLTPAEAAATAAALDAAPAGGSARERGGQVYARRNLLDGVPEVRALARSERLVALAEAAAGAGAFPVRGILFDKAPGANWGVGWHQDLAIAVRDRRETPGFSAWSVKAGLTHVQPPVQVLERMVTLRVQLDDGDPRGGPLRVIPGSHRGGRLGPEAVREWAERGTAVDCPVPKGGVLLIRPLLLHASSPAAPGWDGRRRVVHLEYASGPLPGGLRWVEDELPEVASR